MPLSKLRPASPLLVDRHSDESEVIPQNEGYQSLHHDIRATDSADGADLVVDIDEGVGIHLGGSGGHGDEHERGQDSEVDSGNGDADRQYHNAPATGNAAMADAPPSDSSMPWLGHIHSLYDSSSPQIPFGYQLDYSTSNANPSPHDHNMSDSDGGGAILNSPTINDPDSHANAVSEGFQSNHDIAPPAQQSPMSDNGGPSASMPVGGDFFSDNDGGSLAPNGGGLPFGLVQTQEHLIAPPIPWSLPNELPAFMEPPAAPDVPAQPPPGATIEEDLPPIMPSTTNSMILGSENLGLVDFLRFWAHRGPIGNRSLVPDIQQIHDQASEPIEQVTYSDLRGDQCDFQGLNWAGMGTTRAAARARRHDSYKNYVNRDGSDRWEPHRSDVWIPSTESYFRFRKMNMRQDVSLAHFQLRSVLACPSRSHVYYSCPRGINRLNPISSKTDLALNLGEFPVFGRAITTLDANCGVLVGGTFNGEFVIKSLYSQNKKQFSEGLITGGVAGITNHLQVHTPRRSSSPVAAISSNDCGFRILDIQTEQIVSDFLYHFPLNCSSISPDRRLRILVGDTNEVTITNAETGETEVELDGHQDYGFACDWSEDGRTVATGFQDKSVKIWDTRKWTDTKGAGTPLASIWCDMAGARSLRFSPLGSGEPVLVAAEEADYINIIDARTFQKKQTIDLVGEIGGIAFNDQGQELNVLISDTHRGGLVQFDRCGLSSGGRRPTMLERMEPF